jgi:hypothetical protein
MTDKEAYKIGFMLKCAELGVDPEVAAVNLVKYATLNPIEWIKSIFGLGKGVVGAAGTALKFGLPLGLGASLLTGGALGHYAAKATTPNIDIGEIKKDEETEAYETAIAKLRNNLRRRGVNVDADNSWFG